MGSIYLSNLSEFGGSRVCSKRNYLGYLDYSWVAFFAKASSWQRPSGLREFALDYSGLVSRLFTVSVLLGL
jgi:hypothetical protein